MNDISSKLNKLLGSFDSLPFLFIGSGLTLRYKDSYNWDGLLKELSSRANNGNSLMYNNYKDRAKRTSDKISIESKVASFIENDFNDSWYEEKNFHKLELFKELLDKEISPLKIEIAEIFKEISKQENKGIYTKEIELLKKIGKKSISGVITTNYDTSIEDFFDGFEYDVYIGQEELVFSDFQGSGEIFKIHGCCTKPETIIINDDDYRGFNQKNAYLAAKLLTIFLEHPIIFIGYSICDKNIKEVLTSIARCLSKENLDKLNKRFFFVEWNDTDKEDTISEYEFGLEDDKSIVMTKISLKDFSTLYEAISKNKACYNPRVLKKIRGDIYKAIIENKPTKSLSICLDMDDSRLDELEVVAGIAVIEKFGERGYGGLEPKEIFKDIIYDDRNFDNDKVVEQSLVGIFKFNQSIPIIKYLSRYNDDVPNSLKKYYKEYETLGINYLIPKATREKKNKLEISINELRKRYGNYEALKHIKNLDYSYSNLNDINMYLKELLNQFPNILEDSHKSFYRTEMRRLVKIYDYLKYKK